MAEEEWNDEIADAPPKRKVPGWLWFCGGGCLLFALIAIVAAVLFGKLVMKANDPDQQWEQMAEVLPFEGRPEHLRMILGWQWLVEFYELEDDRGYVLFVNDLGPSPAEDADQDFGEGLASLGMMGVGGIEGGELGTAQVQGLELPVQRFRQSGGSSLGDSGQFRIPGGQGVLIKMPRELSEGMVLVFIVRSGGGEQPITDDAIRQVLEPFQIGPGYVKPESFGPDTPVGDEDSPSSTLESEAPPGDSGAGEAGAEEGADGE